MVPWSLRVAPIIRNCNSRRSLLMRIFRELKELSSRTEVSVLLIPKNFVKRVDTCRARSEIVWYLRETVKGKAAKLPRGFDVFFLCPRRRIRAN